MLTVTEAAKSHLADLLQQSKAPDEAAMRIIKSPTGLELAIDREKPGDQSFTDGDNTILVVDPDLAGALDAATLDIEKTANGVRLRLAS